MHLPIHPPITNTNAKEKIIISNLLYTSYGHMKLKNIKTRL